MKKAEYKKKKIYQMKGLVEYYYDNNRTKLNFDELKQYINKISKEVYKRMDRQARLTAGISVLMRTKDGHYHRSVTARVGHDVAQIIQISGNDELDEDAVSEFNVFVRTNAFVTPANNARGGSSEYNDCLFDCLMEIVGKNRLPWKKPEELKRFLKLNRDDKVDVSLLAKIEDKLKQYRISCSGHGNYYSPKKNYQKEINLNLYYDHYTIEHHKGLKLWTNLNEKIPLLWMRNKKYETIAFDPKIKQERVISDEEFKTIQNNQTKYIQLECTNFATEFKTLKDKYEYFVKTADILKDETDGLINLYKTGNISNTAQHLFYHFYDCKKPTPMNQNEMMIISKLPKAQLMSAQPYKGMLYRYDFCAFYASIMASVYTMFPIDKPVFETFTELPKILKFGCYHCTIKNTEPKLFLSSFDNWYAHYDIQTARELGFQIELIQDKQPNAMLYERKNLRTGSQMFKKYVDYVYRLKTLNVPEAKSLLTHLHGKLAEKNTEKIIIKEVKTHEEQKEYGISHLIDEIKKLNDKSLILYPLKIQKPYKNEYFARCIPFLLAKARQKIALTMKPHIEKIRWVNTDGFISIEKLNIKCCDKENARLGDLGYEGCHEGIIQATNKITKAPKKTKKPYKKRTSDNLFIDE